MKCGCEAVGVYSPGKGECYVIDDQECIVNELVRALDSANKIVADRAAGGRMITTQSEAEEVWGRCDRAIQSARGKLK